MGVRGGAGLGVVCVAMALGAPAVLGGDDAAVAGGLAVAGMPLACGAAVLIGTRWATRMRRAGVRIVRWPDSPLAFMAGSAEPDEGGREG
jgi:hypothetical protein